MWHILPECALAAWHWAPGSRSVRMGGGIRPESPKVAPRRRAESRRARSAVQRETSEWKFLIHQLRLSAPVRLRSSATPRRTESDRARSSISRPPPSPHRRVMTNIIFCDPAFDLPAKGSGRIQSARPSMDMAGQNRKVFISGRFLIESVFWGEGQQGVWISYYCEAHATWRVWWGWWVNGLRGLVSVAVGSPRAAARAPPACAVLSPLSAPTQSATALPVMIMTAGSRVNFSQNFIPLLSLHFSLHACSCGCRNATMKTVDGVIEKNKFKSTAEWQA